MRILQRATLVALACLVPAVLTASAAAEEGEEGAQEVTVAEGREVSIEYTLTTDAGEVADTNVGGDPLVYTQGAGQVLPSLEQALAGLEAGDTKKVSLTPEQGYGVVDPNLFQTVPADQVPEDARVVGTQLVAQSQDGERRLIRVHEVKGDEIVMDLNHPLAGENLHFDVKILSVE